MREEDSNSRRDKIVVLEVKKLRNQKSEIVLSNGSSIMIAEDVMYLENVFPGLELTQPQIEKIEYNSQVVIAKKCALAFVARQPYSRRMLELKLIRKEIRRKAIDEALTELENSKLIDDETLSREWVAFRISHHPEGKKHIYLGLLKKGIEKHVAQTVVEELLPFETECEAARKALEKARSIKQTHTDRSAFLKSRGFSYKVINEVIKNN